MRGLPWLRTHPQGCRWQQRGRRRSRGVPNSTAAGDGTGCAAFAEDLPDGLPWPADSAPGWEPADSAPGWEPADSAPDWETWETDDSEDGGGAARGGAAGVGGAARGPRTKTPMLL